jgi:hypothetical protein
MTGGACDLGEVLTRLLADADAGLTAGGDEAFQAHVLTLAGDKDVVKASAAGLQRLFDGMNAVESIHVSSVKG